MSLIQETDYGTPRAKSETMVTTDHRRSERHSARGHLDHARRNGSRHADPETLRHRHGDAFGSCRLCLVEIEAAPARLLLHHAGDAGPGHHTQSERLKKLRKGVMELYISDHPLDCLTCGRQWRLRAAGYGGRRRSARRPLRL